jgi:hypothetical protein
MEMGDIPILDKGGYVMLGSDDYLLRMLTAKKDQKAINDYVVINRFGNRRTTRRKFKVSFSAITMKLDMRQMHRQAANTLHRI